jgi:hypothetical protein
VDAKNRDIMMRELNVNEVQEVNGGMQEVIDAIREVGKEIGKFLHDLFHDC